MRVPVGDVDAAVTRMRGDAEGAFADFDPPHYLARDRIDDHHLLAFRRGEESELAIGRHGDAGRFASDFQGLRDLEVAELHDGERVVGLVGDEGLADARWLASLGHYPGANQQRE